MLTRYMDGRTDGRTNGQGDSYIPPKLCLRGYNKTHDIKFSAHNMFLEYPSSVTLKIERLENKIILKILGASKSKGLNRTVKIG